MSASKQTLGKPSRPGGDDHSPLCFTPLGLGQMTVSLFCFFHSHMRTMLERSSWAETLSTNLWINTYVLGIAPNRLALADSAQSRNLGGKDYWFSLGEMGTARPAVSDWRGRFISERGNSSGNHMEGVRRKCNSWDKRRVLLREWEKSGWCLKRESFMTPGSKEIWPSSLPPEGGWTGHPVSTLGRGNMPQRLESCPRLHRL